MPSQFVWGAAASAYQIEGAAREDGKGVSVWDTYIHKPGVSWEGQTGDVACDHYHRYREDVALMRRIGLGAYRLSISWPRVLPLGTGKINEPGLGFYDRLIDELLGAGITPYVTLFHWDFPQALHDRGGWLNRESAEWFAEYARVIVDRLGDRVSHWMTLNEPQIYIGGGPGNGVQAPGDPLTLREQLLSTHHTLLAHGRAVRVIRERAKLKPTVGWAPVGVAYLPASDRDDDIRAAREMTLSVKKRDMWNNTWYADAVCFGRYPEDGLRVYGDDAPEVKPGDMETIAAPLDFFGLNIYFGFPVRAGADGTPETAPRKPGYDKTILQWPVDPSSLYWGPKFIHERYRLPIMITENGLSSMDWVAMDGRVHDTQRIDFTRRYLIELRRAIADSVDVRGYFHWSVMDNLEWASAFKERFGLIHIDFETQKRTLKDSAEWYGAVIRSNGAALDRDWLAGER